MSAPEPRVLERNGDLTIDEEYRAQPEFSAETHGKPDSIVKPAVLDVKAQPRQIRTKPAEVIKDIKAALEGAQDRPPLKLKTIPAGDSGNGAAA